MLPFKVFSLLAAVEIVVLTTSSASSDGYFIKMIIFSFQCASGNDAVMGSWRFGGNVCTVIFEHVLIQIILSILFEIMGWELNPLRPRQYGRHFPDDILKWIFLNENVWISITISWTFVPRGPMNNFVIIGLDNGLAPTRWQAIIWTNGGYFIDAYMLHSASMS